MCGIFCILDIKSEPKVRRDVALQQVKLLRHRGPDWSGIFSDDHAVLAHERLAIVDTVHGAQPLFNKSTGAALAVNGEIYNHQDLRAELKNNHQFQTNSDCEIILYLYQEYGLDCVKYLNGIFAFVLYDPRQKTFIVARDHIGIVPLYIGFDQTGTMYVASEMKALLKVCDKIEEFPPGHIYEGKLGKEVGKFHKYYNPDWAKPGNYPKNKYDPAKLRNAMTKAIERQLMSDVPLGIFLSGGIDSSIIVGVISKLMGLKVTF